MQIANEIEAARDAVAQAALEWDPSNLGRVQASLVALETSLPHLKTALDAIPDAGPLPVEKVREAALALQAEAGALEFLVDAAAAFIRSSDPEGCNQTYDPGGEVRLQTQSPIEVYTG